MSVVRLPDVVAALKDLDYFLSTAATEKDLRRREGIFREVLYRIRNIEWLLQQLVS